jgi:hypothetical protein
MLQTRAASVDLQGRSPTDYNSLNQVNFCLTLLLSVNFLIFSKLMLEETDWIYNGMLQARTAYRALVYIRVVWIVRALCCGVF